MKEQKSDERIIEEIQMQEQQAKARQVIDLLELASLVGVEEIKLIILSFGVDGAQRQLKLAVSNLEDLYANFIDTYNDLLKTL